jgi:hypothetical protein
MPEIIPTSLDGHVLLTGADGAPRDPETAARTLRGMAGADRVVLHFHGGLVSQERGLAVAGGLKPVYERADAYPVFVVWRSGLFEIVGGNLAEIAREETFKRLLKRLLRYAVAKAATAAGAREIGAALPAEHDVALELEQLQESREPFGELKPDRAAAELSAADEQALELEIQTDSRLQGSLQAAVNERMPEPEPVRSRGIVVATVAAEGSRLDPAALAEIAPPSTAGARAIVSMTIVARKAVRILARVVARFRRGTDHGVYVTVVEELLREFYLANAGALVWHAMKQETADTFVRRDPLRGGVLLLDSLRRSIDEGRRPSVSLVGHSTGAVFINRLIADAARRRAEPAAALPGSFSFEHIVFLAPACTCSDFATVIEHQDLWRSFRMFTMDDVTERNDPLVPLVYPRSLLYFVSGVLERDAEGAAEAGKPLVGLARWLDRDRDGPAEVRSVRDYLLNEDGRVVWSPSSGPPGRSAGALSHGDFDDDGEVRESLVALLSP